MQMNSTFKILSVLAAFAATPALAAEPDAHASHHPAGAPEATAPATPAPQTDAAPAAAQGCPMMKGQMMGGQMPMQGAQGGGAAPAPGGQMPMQGAQGGSRGMAGMGSGGMMMGGKGMTCTQGAPAKSSGAAHHRRHRHHRAHSPASSGAH